MATFRPNSKITIGRFKPFAGVHEVVIKKSLRSYLDTAMVKIPATSRLKQSGQAQSQSVDTAKLFKRGDRIKIELGYDGVLKTEFEGFVSRVNMTTPCEIECEGFAYLLREKTINKVWKNTTVKAVLSEIIAGTGIVLGDVDEVVLSVFSLIKENGFKSLEVLQKACGQACNIWFEGNLLHAGLKYYHFTEKNKEGKPDVVYKIGWNVVRDSQMKERVAGDNRVEIEFYHAKKDGKKTTALAGVPNSNYQRKKLQAIADQGTLKKLAGALEASKNYTGFDGSIMAFLRPFCLPGMKAKIIDPRYQERSGNYLVEGTEVKYNRSGARRTVDISFKL